MIKHEVFEKNSIILLGGIVVTVAIGGLVEIVPLFTIGETIEQVEGVRPYSPLELQGRNIYIREGCYLCHSQQVRPFRDEIERYGPYSLAAESIYDHPFQWGSKRTGPDLARVGGKYSNDWHVAHMINPRAVVPESIMPSYAHLAARELRMPDIAEHLKALSIVGVPYNDEMIENARTDFLAQATPDADTEGVLARYPKAVIGDFDGNPASVTEMDALIAYLQVLGRMVDFTTYRPDYAGAVEAGAQ
ncbi:cytochrome c oxidase cbb3-type subunit 2 [Dongia mobilis]|uniref:Cytochrome c oxidase cbb3-type subunit 2 n=1 Tax=Dongia mobilis TaxID=578943 RepID=A0A4V3DDQ5_9PROT|nr:cytochrome-c oxidase, cbb3-type subunit II [Dongia mobilis]TDQ77552.1 cytochrome c oxidase cbb3-type subunit 2 [Dongia mobilis]